MYSECNKFKRSDMIAVAVCVAVLALALVISQMLPDIKPGIIAKKLSEKGCNVSGITFQYLEKGDGFREYVYESSQPVLYQGHAVSRWSVADVSFSSLIPYYSVSPYPSLPEERMVKITLNLTESQYSQLLEALDGESLEQYLMAHLDAK
jgi:hypothetical protein